ncbi:MAG: S-adenosylmethionine decarboxylase [Candidatus Accumulibacter sp.]|jgi:S-adenosylmethionine decarboxylase proenzyme|nr:S-adenosylmethionine decarboxylase [Accumulibacter sp.]
MNGLHIVAELYDCRCEARLLASVEALRGLCLAVCAVPGLTTLGELFHQFAGPSGSGAGATGVVILAESHLAVHTWPEIRAVTFDLYVCNFTQDNRETARAACDRLVSAFLPARAVRREIERGTPPPPSARDEIPSVLQVSV